jgi:predicted nucleic-acid-binding protein
MGMLDNLLNREEMVFEQADVMRSALELFRIGKADFADCLIATSARAAGCTKTLTFDRIAARDAGMELVV